MTAQRYSPGLTVAQVLEQTTQDAVAVLIARRTACVGCYLAGFCTLEDVARTYRIPLEELLDELEGAAHPNHPSFIGAPND